jgi:cell division protein ZapA (FtsZ GTPase activity inhibitor)
LAQQSKNVNIICLLSVSGINVQECMGKLNRDLENLSKCLMKFNKLKLNVSKTKYIHNNDWKVK